MSREITEADWKLFRELRTVALERLCERTLAEVGKLCVDSGRSFHERYNEVYRRIEDRDKELARVFDDLRRSRMLEQLAQMRTLHLIQDDELAKFSEQTQAVVALLSGG